MSSTSKLSALLLLALIIGSSIYLYLNQSGFLGYNISQIPYEEIKTQDTRIVFSGSNTETGFDPYAWGDMGEFLANLSYGFYDMLAYPSDLPFTPPINPLLAPLYLPLMQAILFNVTPANPARYWKMTAYDEYSGESWAKTISSTQPLNQVTEGPLIYQVNINITNQLRGETLLPVISPEPLIINGSLNIATSSDLISQSLRSDAYGSAILSLTFSAPSYSSISYQVTFTPIDLASMQANSLPPSYTDEEIRAVYLQLPSPQSIYLESNSRLAAVIEMFRSYAESNSVYDTAVHVLSYLSGNYVFDPFASYPGGLDRVEWFLESGRGTSFDFATAYAIILRCLNISSRLVYGFLPGEQIGDTRVIRGWNVHFWVEVFNPTSTGEDNWIQFDPTPLPGDITDIVGADSQIGDVEYNLILNVQNQSSWTTARGDIFELEVFLTNNTGPMGNTSIEVYDLTENTLITMGLTNQNGLFTYQYSYNSANRIGPHIIYAFPSSLPLIRNYTLIIVDGLTQISLEVSPNPPENVTRGRERVTLTGRIIDDLNNQPIPNQYLSIIFNGVEIGRAVTDNSGYFNYTFTPPLTSIGEATLRVYFNGVFQYYFNGQILQALAPSAESYSDEETIIIVASTTLTTELNRTAVAPGDWIRISGYLTFDNRSGYAAQPVSIYWANSSGTFMLNVVLTEYNGFYYYDYRIPAGIYGEAKIFSVFTSTNPYVLSSFTDPTLYIGEEKITMLSCSPSSLRRNEYTSITGLLTNSSDSPLPGRTVIINFYSTNPVRLTASTTAVTNETGWFSLNYLIPVSFQPGTYIINCSTTSPLVVASEYIYLNVTSSTRVQFEAHPLFIAPGENFSITGLILDDQGAGLTVNLYFYVNSVLQYNLSAINGFFQVITHTLPLGYSHNSVNLTIQFTGSSFYTGSNHTQQLMVFTSVIVYISVDPSLCSPGQGVEFNVTAVDNYGRRVYDRTVNLFLNNTLLTTLYLDTPIKLVEWVIPENTPNGPITVYGVLETNVNSSYSPATLTVQVVGLQLTSEYIIIIVAVVVIICVSLIYFVVKRRVKASRKTVELDISGQITRLQQYIREGKSRESLLFMFNLLEQLISRKYNLKKASYQTIREYAEHVTGKTDINSKALYDIVGLVEKAKYSKLDIAENDLAQAMADFKLLYTQLTGVEF
ncbi:MAG: hypothetical protein OdinLCB4_005670 [Candidatus Odinarchaeum yellowstonii]|uniref:Transglutaminase-like domain-containing protein n=1 Tax=Odinarchaeota yellowstonii (strain LCB_4) TaxID=1841599 RepID=A0AAF0IBH1_ODILC|nr:MAG: hypothetical protein OdinLCB4_005670 [Candidatus Odinarchaeum yellowstonii]